MRSLHSAKMVQNINILSLIGKAHREERYFVAKFTRIICYLPCHKNSNYLEGPLKLKKLELLLILANSYQ